jgi:hypothetical protein
MGAVSCGFRWDDTAGKGLRETHSVDVGLLPSLQKKINKNDYCLLWGPVLLLLALLLVVKFDLRLVYLGMILYFWDN